MSNQILVPSLGESVTEATVSKWLKQVGEEVDSDEPLVELETDKVNVEVPSPLTGTLSSIKAKEGDTVEIGALLGIVNDGKSTSVKTAKMELTDQNQQSYMPPKTYKKKNIAKETVKKNKKTSSKKEEPLIIFNQGKDENSNGALILDTLAEEDSSEIKEEKYIPPKTRQHLSPSVRKIVEEKNIDIFINARTDYFIMGLDNSLEETIKRVKLYEESGADGIFVPCIVNINDIKEVVKSTTLPVNIMTMPDLLSFDILQQTGIKRISQGPFIYNSLMESFENKLKTINKDNSFKSLF